MASIERDGDRVRIRTMHTSVQLQIRRGLAPELGLGRRGFVCLLPTAAQALIQEACRRDPFLSSLLRKAALWANPREHDTGHVDDDLERAIASGRLGVVSVAAIDSPELSWDKPSQPQPVTPPPPGGDKPKQPTELTFFEVRVVDELGQPITGVPLGLRVGDDQSERPDQPTDGDGRVRVDDVRGSHGWVQVSDLDALRELVRPRWDQIRPGEWLEAETDRSVHPLRADRPIEHALLSETLHTLVIQPWVIRARLLGMYFDTNKCFLLPSALGDIKQLKLLYDDNPQSEILVVGHTDTTGEPWYNDPLSLERADATAAFLKDDVDAWLPWYGFGVPPEKRWGSREDGLMLLSLPDAASLQATGDPVREFQRTRGLDVDGWMGPDTRRQLIGEYMAHDATSLPPEASLKQHGCGENFPLQDQELQELMDALEIDDDQVQRRVELYFFDRPLGVQPPPPGDNSPPGGVEYPEWGRRAQQTHDFAQSQVLRVRLFDHFAAPMADEEYLVEIGDLRIEGRTDALGCVVLKGKLPAVSTCTVRWNRLPLGDAPADPELEFEFEQVVHLDANERVDDDAVAARLHNLGFSPAAELRDNVRHFQCQHDLPPTGDSADPAMRALLAAEHQAMTPKPRPHQSSPGEPAHDD